MITRILPLLAVLALAGCASTGSTLQEKPWIGCAVVGGVAGAGFAEHADENAAGGAAGGAALGALLCAALQSTPEDSDGDGDGVNDDQDKCPATRAGVEVNVLGCTLDADGDGVFDHSDRCPGSAPGVAVGADGCEIDSDGDGVLDRLDQCPQSRAGAAVSGNGCEPDSDKDGVLDGADTCPATPAGTPVDMRGCPRDGDGDGVSDGADACPGTRAGLSVDARGCVPQPPARLVLKGVSFLSNSAELTLPSLSVLSEVVHSLLDNPEVRVEIGGHTDAAGSESYNQALSQRRAEAVHEYFVNRGVEEQRMRSRGYGESQPIADNNTAEGRERNRRVELRRID